MSPDVAAANGAEPRGEPDGHFDKTGV